MLPECGALNQTCLTQGLDAPLALGAHIELRFEYQIAGSTGPPTTLESVDPNVLTVTDQVTEGSGVGASALSPGPAPG